MTTEKDVHTIVPEVPTKRPFKASMTLIFYVMCWTAAFAYLLAYESPKVKDIIFSFNHSIAYFLGHNILAFIFAATAFVGVNYFFPYFVPVIVCIIYAVLMLCLFNMLMMSFDIILAILTVVLLFSLGYLIYFIFKNISSIASTIKAASSLIFTNIIAVLNASILLSTVLSFQLTVIYLYIDINPFRSESFDHPLFFVSLFLHVLSASILFNFITVFVSSVIYNSYQKTGVTVSESFIIALSSFPAIFKSAFYLSVLAVLNQYLEILLEKERRKPDKEKNVLIIIALYVAIIILDIITRIFQEISFLIMNYIGIFGGDFDFETSAKANQILTFEHYQAYRNSGFSTFAYLIFMGFYGLVLYLMQEIHSIFSLWEINKYELILRNIYDSKLSSPEIAFLSVCSFISFTSFFFICAYNTASVAYLYAKMKNSQHY